MNSKAKSKSNVLFLAADYDLVVYSTSVIGVSSASRLTLNWRRFRLRFDFEKLIEQLQIIRPLAISKIQPTPECYDMALKHFFISSLKSQLKLE
ncbi:hypothetical protein LXL04_027725 [Taraxacum kok-saghyz]